jgi:PAS domain S-box-containing protein
MTEPSGYILEPIREGADFTLYRGRQRGNPSAVLAVGLAGERPSPQGLRRLEDEYSLAAELDPAWAAKPLALTRHEGRAILVLTDPGGEPLDLVLERDQWQPLDVTRFLRIAIGLATAIGQVHRRGLIHKDVKPANVLVDDAGKVSFTGFGIASRLPRENQTPAPPEIIAGTLAYMAPEQTGRMNRSIDARSDLYSLGVTLYQMLTGALPFAAADALEWVHCHIARQPVPPAARAAVPEPLSSLTMKLLAKNAEDRYQTASGLEADLRRCLAEWQSQGRIDPFPLGTHDAPDRLLIPEKLYGREREVDVLLASFDRVVALGTTELVLVSGYSGVGKSSVVNELHKALVPPRGFFASGKFDQYKRDIPYATLAQAFQTLVRQILVKNEAELGQWRSALAEAVGPNGQLIVSLIPEVEFIIGKQPPVPDLSPRDAQNRFQVVFRRFLGAFARAEHPLALFLDDLQWLDAATLELLERLITDPDVRHLMLVGAYRDNEVTSSHPLARTLAAIRKAGAKMQEIVLVPLRLDDVGQLVVDTLHCEPDHARPLAELVHEKTGGNPFFAIQFLTTLAEEGLLGFDPEAVAWVWDLARIRAKGYTDNVVDLMVGKLSRLPETTQEALRQLACLGNVVESATLALVYGKSEEEMEAALWEAARTGLIRRLDGAYAFLHDRVQEAAYVLIPEAERAAAHLRIGRVLAARTAPEEIEEKIFEIVNQFDRGVTLIDLPEERERVAELNLIAGKRAKTSTAYASALNYLAAGRELLGEDSWERRYELIFSLEYHRAECELHTADLAAAEERLTMLSRRAANLVDIAAVACLRLTLYTTLDRSDRGVEVCLEFLDGCGIHWSPNPSKDDVRGEYERIWAQVGGRSIEELVDLPLMIDVESRAILDVLTEVVTPALFTDENLLSLVICRMANLSLEHGNSDGSCFAYVWLGMILGPHFGDYQAGFRFGRLGYDLVEKRGLHRYQARAYMSFGNLVMPWTKHIQSGRDLVRRAFDTANKIGDLTFAAYCCNNLNTNLLASGDPLRDAQSEAENGLAFARKARFGLVIDIITAQRALIRTLLGETREFGSLTDEELDETRFEDHLQRDSRLALPECWYWIRKLQARVYAGDYVSAIEAGQRAERLLWTSPSFFELAEYHFYGALARAGRCQAAAVDERPRHLEALAEHNTQLHVWAENCPENFGNRAALVDAEIARLEGHPLDAMHFYERAIQSAREHGFVHNEGLAHELAARFYLAGGFETIGHTYLRNARNSYDRWGAHGKVKQLEESHPRLQEERISPSTTATIGTSLGQLDAGTVLKASQALSSEMLLDKLIEKLMRIAVEYAGAERGVLILLRGDEPRIEAEATTRDGRVEVAVREATVTPSDLPQSALHYVIRTRERVVLDDASVGNLYSADEYVRKNRPRSVICLPIVKQTKLAGALYLENNLTPCAFTSDRVTVLELLASQAAISLENASLYSDLMRSQAFLSEAQTISHTGSFGWNTGSGEVYWSEETCDLFEHDRAVKPTLELVFQRIHPDDRDLVRRALYNAAHENTDFDIEHRLLMPDSSIKHLHVIGRASNLSPSDNLEYVGAVTDVTTAKQAEDKLRRSEESLLEAQGLSHTGSWRRDVASGAVIMSPEQHRIFGISPDELASKVDFWFDRIHPEDRARIGELVKRSAADGTDYEVDYRIVLPGGAVKHIHAVGHPVLNEAGAATEFVGTTMDVTAAREAEDKIRQSEREVRQRLDLSPQHIAEFGPDGSRLYVNQVALDYRGMTFEQWQAADLKQMFHPQDAERLTREIPSNFLGGTPFEMEARLRRKDGQYRWFLFRFNPILDEQGRITRWYSAGTDIQDRKHAEQRLQNENVALREEIDRASMFEQIVGTSLPLRNVLSRVSKVAPTDSTVLITGETGTGKELVARAVHRRSRRSSRAFVSVNCAAVPRELIASELFGHEKGAFTGATQRRLGRFELAEGGTIFLDEVGELPAETQIALLRVLQEREFERVGGTGSIRSEVRVIAATNRDMEAAIAAGTFRSDLFYRLNVFPIEVPALRERKEDIPLLVEYFIDRFARQAGKSFQAVNKKSLDLLQSYPWPGNIRELQNVIERSVVVCETETFSVDESWLSRRPPASDAKSEIEFSQRLATQEKEMIEAALRESGGRVFGPSGAAAKLGMPRSTLESKIRSFKIDKTRFKAAGFH